jgi:hypothetical protein
MMIEEVANALRLMGREVVDDDVDLATSGLARDDVTKEGNEFLGRVACRGLPEHLTALGAAWDRSDDLESLAAADHLCGDAPGDDPVG